MTLRYYCMTQAHACPPIAGFSSLIALFSSLFVHPARVLYCRHFRRSCHEFLFVVFNCQPRVDARVMCAVCGRSALVQMFQLATKSKQVCILTLLFRLLRCLTHCTRNLWPPVSPVCLRVMCHLVHLHVCVSFACVCVDSKCRVER